MMSELAATGIMMLVFTLAIIVFGGGTLLFVGARFAAGIPGAGYWKSVGVHVVSALAGGVVGGILGAIGAAIGPGAAMLLGLAGLGGSLAVTWAVIMGMFHTTYGKAVLAWLPTLGQLILVVPLLLAVMIPGLPRARELARKASCKSNFSAIGKAIAIYTGSYNDQWPPDLDFLIRDGQAPGIFVCPSSGSVPGPGTFDYFYLATNSNADPGTIVLCDYRRNHKDGHRNILYADLHVGEALTDADFEQELALPRNAAFAKALRAAEAQRP